MCQYIHQAIKIDRHVIWEFYFHPHAYSCIYREKIFLWECLANDSNYFYIFIWVKIHDNMNFKLLTKWRNAKQFIVCFIYRLWIQWWMFGKEWETIWQELLYKLCLCILKETKQTSPQGENRRYSFIISFTNWDLTICLMSQRF